MPSALLSARSLARQATGTTHPPAGATGLLAALAELDAVPWAGFKFLLTAAAGRSVMVVMAVLFNNLVPGRRYPTFW